MSFSSLPTWFGFNFPHEEIETKVSVSEGSYRELSREALYTCEEDFRRIFTHPLVTGTFVDLGCGTGLGCLMYSILFPERKAIGLEREQSRLETARSLQLNHKIENLSLMEADLLTTPIPDGESYFLYFPTGPVLDRILTTLYEKKRNFRLIAIESHGDLLPRLKLENWLKVVATIPLSSPRHHPEALIFERTQTERHPTLRAFELSYQDTYLLITDSQEEWIGETRGLTWLDQEIFNLETPPRTISWKSVKKLMTKEELSPHVRLVSELRRKGELEFFTLKGVYRGFIRKIIVSPVFHLEISSGERIEWSHIVSIKKDSFLCYDSSSSSF